MLNKILRSGENKRLKKYFQESQKINELEQEIIELDDSSIRERVTLLREKQELSRDDIFMIFALVREAAKRTLGQRHYDVQIVGGLALLDGNIAEMKTGEGKTLVSTLAASAAAISNRKVHIVTVNDYLAERDCNWMGRIYGFLGLSYGYNSPKLNQVEKREVYKSDIVYGTNTEFGFDYLRDNMVKRKEDKISKGYDFAVVDEVDSILIDEARTPLIISGEGDGELEIYKVISRSMNLLKKDVDYEVDEKKNTVTLKESGESVIERYLKIDNLYTVKNSKLLPYVLNGIKAKELFLRDRDYIVRNREVLIVDEHTGRVLEGRRYSDGLHQAIEAKEGVIVNSENKTLATITLQNFFRLYQTLSGMTGTAMTEESEFYQIYKLGVVAIPTNREMKRIDRSDLIYGTKIGKYKAIVNDIKERYEKGQPILVGTTSVENSEIISKELKKAGIKHEVLNAKNHERESHIIGRAGMLKSVTVATNMAGRGTDIILGGNPEIFAMEEIEENKRRKNKTELNFKEIRERYEKESKENKEKVISLGGLYVIGTERHESRRIDNQLRGRAGRQGDPGESRFFLSLEDDIMRRFGGDLLGNIMNREANKDLALESKIVTNSIKRAQGQVESLNFEMRKDILKYDDVINVERKIIYKRRDEIIENVGLEVYKSYISYYINNILFEILGSNFSEEWDRKKLLEFAESISENLQDSDVKDFDDISNLGEYLSNVAVEEFERKISEIPNEDVENIIKEIFLISLDRHWQEHIHELDYLREGINLRAIAQKDPLVEYKAEAVRSFEEMESQIKIEIGSMLVNLEIKIENKSL